MSDSSVSLMDRFMAGLRRLFAAEPVETPATDAVPRAAAVLFAEVARVDHDVKDIDLAAARGALQALFAVSRDQSEAMMAHALAPENRPTSYHAISSLLNRSLSPQHKIALIEQMWRIARIDDEIDMYEDHLVRKIADLLYVPHSEFIAAKQRARPAG